MRVRHTAGQELQSVDNPLHERESPYSRHGWQGVKREQPVDGRNHSGVTLDITVSSYPNTTSSGHPSLIQSEHSCACVEAVSSVELDKCTEWEYHWWV